MSNRIFVGNIPYDATEQELKEFFQKAGNITQVVIPKDRETGKPRGFAFVEFETAAQMQESVFKLNNALLRDRKIIVSEAKKKEPGKVIRDIISSIYSAVFFPGLIPGMKPLFLFISSAI